MNDTVYKYQAKKRNSFVAFLSPKKITAVNMLYTSFLIDDILLPCIYMFKKRWKYIYGVREVILDIRFVDDTNQWLICV